MANPKKTTQVSSPKAGHFCMPQEQVNQLVQGIIQILRKNFEAMIQDLKTGQTKTPPQSVFSKIKNFLWGYENPNNPWYLANRLGGLGYKSSNEVTLHEYNIFGKWIDDYNEMKMKLKEERLVLDDMIKPFLRRLEDEIRDYVRDFLQTHYVFQPTVTAIPQGDETAAPAKKRRTATRSASKEGGIAGTGAETVEPIIKKQQKVGDAIEGGRPPAAISPKGGRPPAAISPTGEKERWGREFEGGEEEDETQIEHSLQFKIKQEFAGSTLYERTLICLDKLRNSDKL